MFDRDASVAVAVESCLDRNLSLPVGSVCVHVSNGWVTLAGCLDWQFQHAAAECGITDIAGVIGLTNCTTVRAGGEAGSRDDREFAGYAFSHG